MVWRYAARVLALTEARSTNVLSSSSSVTTRTFTRGSAMPTSTSFS